MRPLYIEELAEIFILDPDKTPSFDEEDRICPVEAVLSYLPGLVVKVIVKEKRGRSRRRPHATEIRFAHYFIQEYLSSERALKHYAYFSTRDQAASHLHIAESCFTYHLQLSDAILVTEERLTQYQLWEYAAREGLKHLECVSRNSWTPSAIGRMARVTANQSQSLKTLRLLTDTMELRYSSSGGTALYHAAEFELLQVASYWIENGADVDEFCIETIYEVPLVVACYGSSKGLITLLLRHDAKVNLEAGPSGNALQTAAAESTVEIVQILLDHGANLSKEGGEYGSALQAAAYYGSVSIVQLLLDYGVDVNIGGGMYGSALQAAAFDSPESIIQLLLDHGADVNKEGGEYGNALQAAAYNGSESIIQLLLDHGADVNKEGGEYGNALQAAVYNGSESIIQLFLDRGADVNKEGGKYSSALQTAAYNGCKSTVQLLLDHGADTNIIGGIYGNTLQAAAWSSSESIVQLLLDHGADVNIGGGEASALQLACMQDDSKGALRIIKLLMSSGAKVNVQEVEWQTFLLKFEEYHRRIMADRLRELQDDPSGFLERYERRLRERENVDDEEQINEGGEEEKHDEEE